MIGAELERVKSALVALEDEARGAVPDRGADIKLVVIVVTAALSLLLLQTYGTRHGPVALFALFDDEAPRAVRRFFETHPRGDYWRYAYWLFCVQFFYVFVPLVVVKTVRPRATLADVGLATKGALSHWRLYAILTVVVLVPVVVLASRPGFGSFYPMYKGAHGSLSELLLWELIYLPSFFAVEFFFRGFLLFPFRRRLGALSVLVPLVPYVMIHFGKPLPEAAGASVAALVLGACALASGSVWLGVAVHVAVAVTMDCFAVFFAR